MLRCGATSFAFEREPSCAAGAPPAGAAGGPCAGLLLGSEGQGGAEAGPNGGGPESGGFSWISRCFDMVLVDFPTVFSPISHDFPLFFTFFSRFLLSFSTILYGFLRFSLAVGPWLAGRGRLLGRLALCGRLRRAAVVSPALHGAPRPVKSTSEHPKVVGF